ncbi:hypothetical protein O181_082254 [Austropuccinia psidii MF-1]|uniref:Uncharacterized protein n=1 Tax=Austropuccinia psidii MF-1 TaxID=1389203 RepID=A0A9Q3FPC4_9BASI|nr:hypothetical protein [Austropuccinia psidii MF-1]
MHSTQKCNQAMTPNLNDKSGSRKRSLDMFAPTYENLLESRNKAREISDHARLEWDRERWNEEKVCNMEKQRFEEVKLQKQMEFDEKQNAKKHEFEKEKWNRELELKERQCQMDLTIAALSSSRPIGELERILALVISFLSFKLFLFFFLHLPNSTSHHHHHPQLTHPSPLSAPTNPPITIITHHPPPKTPHLTIPGTSQIGSWEVPGPEALKSFRIDSESIPRRFNRLTF